jgi:hypothetical protein
MILILKNLYVKTSVCCFCQYTDIIYIFRKTFAIYFTSFFFSFIGTCISYIYRSISNISFQSKSLQKKATHWFYGRLNIK